MDLNTTAESLLLNSQVPIYLYSCIESQVKSSAVLREVMGTLIYTYIYILGLILGARSALIRVSRFN